MQISLKNGVICVTIVFIVLYLFAGRSHQPMVHLCGCEAEGLTLVRLGLWPSSPKQPATAFTLDLMELCRAVQLEGHMSLQKFCMALDKQMDFLPKADGGYTKIYRALGKRNRFNLESILFFNSSI